jgi:hypothetical protein
MTTDSVSSDQIKEYLANRIYVRQSRSKAKQDLIGELIEFQRSLMKAMFTVQDLDYLLRDHGHLANEFLEADLKEFKRLNWNNSTLRLHECFRTHSFQEEDFDEYSSVFGWSETDFSDNQTKLQKFKNSGWRIGSNWIDELFSQDEFIVDFNACTSFRVSSDFDYISLYLNGSLFKEYNNKSKALF